MKKAVKIAVICIIAVIFLVAGLVHQYRKGRAGVNHGFDFEGGPTAWTNQIDWDSEACTGVSISDEKAEDGHYSLKMMFDLVGGDEHVHCGEAWADLSGSSPGVGPTQNLTGRTVTAWVYAPPGTLGDAAKPNGYQLFIKDNQWHSEYGSWTRIMEGAWVRLSLTVGKSKPDNGWMDDGFNPAKSMVVGVKVVAGDGSTATYQGPIYVDTVKW